MSTQRWALTGLLVVALLASGASASLAQPAASSAAPASPVAPGAMLIVENAGQWPEAARFQVWNSPLSAGTTWLAEDAIWLVVSRQVDKDQVDKEGRSDCGDPLVSLSTCLPVYSSHALKLTFPGSNPDVRIEPFGAVDTTVSYFTGNDPAQWRPDVPVWGGVRYVDLYPGVDLVLGGSDDAWQLEAAPGVAVGQVRVQVEGAAIQTLDGAMLQLEAVDQLLSIRLPSASFIFQVASLSNQGDILTMAVQPDPRMLSGTTPFDAADLLYSTFLGGSSVNGDFGSGVDVDEAGSAYVTGMTTSSDFPTTPGAFDPDLDGSEAFVVKLNPTGSGLAYASFLGGSSHDTGYAIAVDETGSAFVTGRTDSADFPVTPGAFDSGLGGGEDAFMVKLNQAGSGLVYATYLGGSGYDMGRGIAVDAAGSAYVTGQTWSSDFPSTLGAYATSLKSAIGVFVAKLYPDASNLAYATVLGSTPFDHGLAVAVDAAGSAYVTGIVVTGNFPTTPGAFDPTHNGSDDAFLVKLNPAGSALTYATFLGGAGTDAGYGVVVDGEGGAYVTGLTMSGDFPTTPGAFDSGLGGGGDAFVVKLNPAGSGLVYSTFLGGNREDRSRAIKIDSVGSAYLVGTTESGDFPVTPSAFNPTPGGAEDVFVAKLNPVGSELAYATYLGSNSPDWGEAITLDGQGNVYVVGDTNSSDFPTTPGAFDTSFNGAKDAFVAKLDVYVPNVVAPIEQPRPGGWISGTLTLRGFALDWGSATGPGIDAVRVYLDGPMGSGALLGNATYGLTRPDVAAQYGAAFAPSGWELAWDTTGLPLGIHRLHLYAHRVTDGVWTARPSHLVIIVGEHVRWLPIVLRRQ